MKNTKLRLILLSFLEFGVWGAYLTSLGSYLARAGLAEHIGWFYAVQGIISIFMPAIIGIIADRWIQAQRMLSICQGLAGMFMLGAWGYAASGTPVHFGPLFTMYTLSVAFYMPTIGLSNSVAYNILGQAKLDIVRHFPPIRVFGTVGFICSMLFVNFTGFQNNEQQLLTSGILSLVLSAYSLSLPKCPISRSAEKKILAQAFGLDAFSLFKDKRMALFFIFSMLLGVDLQITNGFANPFIQSFGGIAEFADNWGVKNANALISLSQMSEALCILLIPFFLKRFGIKTVMCMSMFAWVLRFGLFAIGNPGSLAWCFVASMIVYGIAFDFFNVSGSLYVDQKTPAAMRSSAQGLFMLMTNGIGATIGTLSAQQIINRYVYSQPDGIDQIQGWSTSWYIFAAYALTVGVLFLILFHDNNRKLPGKREIQKQESGALEGASGMTEL